MTTAGPTTPEDAVVVGVSGQPLDAAMPVGTIVPAAVDGTVRAVIRHAEGWVMVEDRCSHADCPFTADGEVVDDTVLICNCHGSEFDLRTGAVLLGPADVPLDITRLTSNGIHLRRG